MIKLLDKTINMHWHIIVHVMNLKTVPLFEHVYKNYLHNALAPTFFFSKKKKKLTENMLFYRVFKDFLKNNIFIVT